MGKRVVVALAGCGIGMLIAWLALGPRWVSFGGVGAPIAFWLGERRGRLKPAHELKRPISLFPDGVPGSR
jgi:hypothetical protein